jgi:hypothetical protein
MTDEERRLISEQAPAGFGHRVERGQRMLAMTGLERGSHNRVRASHERVVSLTALCAQVAFNLVGESDPIVIPYGVVVSEAYTRRLKCVYEFDVWGDTIAQRRRKYRVKRHIDRPELQALFEMAVSSVKRRPELGITLRRFCSALIKVDVEDQLIDLAISLESLVPGGGEFRFRFPYYLSLLVDSDAEERKGAFAQLRTLYDARSALVHGSADRGSVVAEAVGVWPGLVASAKRCVLYRLEFEQSMPDTPWSEHLMDLAYGQPPII